MAKEKLKDQIEYCLKMFPKTRNSDIDLTICVWTNFYKSYLVETQKSVLGYGICLEQMRLLPREDHVKRIRAKFNEQSLYLPTEWLVAKKRKIAEEVWREAMSPRSIPQAYKD